MFSSLTGRDDDISPHGLSVLKGLKRTTSPPSVSLPPEVVCEIARFVPTPRVFLNLRMLSSRILALLDKEYFACAAHLQFVVRDFTCLLSRESVAPYVHDVIIPSVQEQEKNWRAKMRKSKKSKKAKPPQFPSMPHLKHVPALFPHVQKLSLLGFPTMPPETFNAVLGGGISGRLTELSLSGAMEGLTCKSFEDQPLPNLRSLTLTNVTSKKVNSKLLLYVSPELESLEVCGYVNFSWHNTAFARLRNLKKIVFHQCSLGAHGDNWVKQADGAMFLAKMGTPTGAFSAKNFPLLEVVHLHKCRQLDAEAFEGVSETVRKVVITDCEGLWGGAEILKHMGREETSFESWTFRPEVMMMRGDIAF